MPGEPTPNPSKEGISDGPSAASLVLVSLPGGGRGGFPASSRQQPTPAHPKRGIRGHSIARGRKAINLLQLIGGHVNIVAEQAGMRLSKGGAGIF